MSRIPFYLINIKEISEMFSIMIQSRRQRANIFVGHWECKIGLFHKFVNELFLKQRGMRKNGLIP